MSKCEGKHDFYEEYITTRLTLLYTTSLTTTCLANMLSKEQNDTKGCF